MMTLIVVVLQIFEAFKRGVQESYKGKRDSKMSKQTGLGFQTLSAATGHIKKKSRKTFFCD